MKPLFNPIAKLFQRLQARFRIARPGSVLILVVALLVLMALLGTAFIATSRQDRYGSAQHTKNVQIDLLVEGVVNMIVPLLEDDLKDAKGVYRPGDSGWSQPTGYDHYDSPGMTTPVQPPGAGGPGLRNNMPDDGWLGPRFPRTQDTQAPAYTAYGAVGGTTINVWDGASYPLFRNNEDPSAINRINSPWVFDFPDSATKFQLRLPYGPLPGTSPVSPNFTAKPLFQPDFITTSTGTYPALQAYAWDPAANPPSLTPVGPKFIAADADGDGVADSGLWKLPLGRIDGVTYYAAVRIIDNNSAINVNTAWSNMEFENGGGSTTTSVTPVAHPGTYYSVGSLGLSELFRSVNLTATTVLTQGAEMLAIEGARFNGVGNPTGIKPAVGTNPYYDSGTAITLYQYQSMQDVLTQQIAHRIGNPGLVNATLIGQPFSISDSMALAYHGGALLNPEASPSALESLIASIPPASMANGDSMYKSLVNYQKQWSSYPLTAAGLTQWFFDSYDYGAEVPGNPGSPGAIWKQRRPMMVASNPVSNEAPAHPLDDYVQTAGIPPYSAAPVTTVVKTSINQAPFGELWRAYWNVMAEEVTVPTGFLNPGSIYRGSPFDMRTLYAARAAFVANAASVRAGVAPNTDPPTWNDPYLGTTFNEYDELQPTGGYVATVSNYDPTVLYDSGALPAPAGYHPERMFRSSMRAVPETIAPEFTAVTPRLNSQQQVLLRSAVAAVNAMDLRDSDDDVTAERVVLQPSQAAAGTSPADAIVYGTERQPYITEVYADTDTEFTPNTSQPNPYGYVAIELYNPYDQDIVMTNWKLVAIDRRKDASPAGSPPPYNNNTTGATQIQHNTVPLPVHNLPLDRTTLIADLDPTGTLHTVAGYAQDVILPPEPTTPGTANTFDETNPKPLVVPARGYLLLENYYDATYASPQQPTGAAGHRPACTGLPESAPIPNSNAGNDRSTGTTAVPTARPGLPRLNVACVPGLSGMIDPGTGNTGRDGWETTEWPLGAGTSMVRSVLNREFVILKPRRADGQYSAGQYPQLNTKTGNYPALPYDENPNPLAAAPDVPYSSLRNLVPVDSYDFTGLQLPLQNRVAAPPDALLKPPINAGGMNTQGQATAWHYVRQTVEPGTAVSETESPNWKFVYPGRYNSNPGTISGTASAATVGGLSGDPRPRQQGTQVTGWANGSGANLWFGSLTLPMPRPIAPIEEFTFGVSQTTGLAAGNENTMASYPTPFKVPIANGNFSVETAAGPTVNLGRNTIGASPLSISNVPPNRYPFGGFARNGDMLAVPFMGAYCIRYQAGAGSTYGVAELNSLSMDSVFAEDTDTHDDPISQPVAGNDDAAPNFNAYEREQLGRFAPIRVLLPTTPLATPDYNGYPAVSFTNYGAPGIAVNDYGYDPSYQPATVGPPTPALGRNWEPWWRYHWATDLFDYLTVYSPADDYLPNYPMQNEFVQGRNYRRGDMISYYDPTANPPAHEIYVCTVAVGGFATAGATPIGDANFQLTFNCQAVKNTNDAAAATRGGTDAQAHSEDSVPVEGLININTANWRVLATLPLVVNPASGLPDNAATAYGISYRQLNQEMAKAICYWRDIDANEDANIMQPHGPFRSIFELNRVVDLRTIAPAIAGFYKYPAGTKPGFQNGYGTMPIGNDPTGPGEADDALGDFTPSNDTSPNTPDGVRSDYEERFLQLNRISNLITTRSDSFTCYVLVQGWRDAEKPEAKLVVQRRVGYIMDRSRSTQTAPQTIRQPFTNN